MQYLDIENWERKKHFYNFLDFSDPFFNITGDVDVSSLKRYCQETSTSFFLASYYAALKVINEIPEFRYRIREDKVIIHEVIHGACTVLRPNKTFSFAYFDYNTDFVLWKKETHEALEEVKANGSLDPQFDRDDLIHASVIPWISFTSFEHAKRFEAGDSTPKVVFGKYREYQSQLMMPISIAGHHSLVDGYHVGLFFEQYQLIANDFEKFVGVTSSK